MPQLTSFASFSIRQPDGPGTRALRNQRKMVLLAGSADEHKLLTVRRPARHQITIRTGRDVANMLRRKIIDHDEAVVAPVRDKGDVVAVRRPLRSRVITAQLGKLTRRLIAGNWGKP